MSEEFEEAEQDQDCCEAGLEEGEICLYHNMPWLHETIGSQMEHQLAYYEKGKCRQCKKDMEEKTAKESFCSIECKKKWNELLELRIKVGKHDLRRRGYD